MFMKMGIPGIWQAFSTRVFWVGIEPKGLLSTVASEA